MNVTHMSMLRPRGKYNRESLNSVSFLVEPGEHELGAVMCRVEREHHGRRVHPIEPRDLRVYASWKF